MSFGRLEKVKLIFQALTIDALYNIQQKFIQLLIHSNSPFNSHCYYIPFITNPIFNYSPTIISVTNHFLYTLFIYFNTVINTYSMRLAFRFSTPKFYQIVQDQQIQILPQIPENAVLSKYLSLQDPARTEQTQKKLSKWQKEKQVKLNYMELLNGSPHGSVQDFVHRKHDLTLISTNYFRINEEKFHKVLYKAKPDIMIIQRRPEYHIQNFQMITKGSDDVFSDIEYLKALTFTPNSLKSQSQGYRPVLNALNKSKEDCLEQNPGKQILQQKGFDLCVKYASAYQTPMIYAEMPMRAYRQWIANTHTLMELQQIFKVVCQRMPRYKSISFNPYQMATLIHPDIFMKLNDNYMATVIEMVIATKKYKKILGVFGIVQNQAVKFMLENNKALGPMIQKLIAVGPKGSIVRDIQNFQIIQKQIILDVMFFGKSVLQLKTQLFHTTNAAIEKYGKEVDRKTMMQFRYDKTTEYVKLMQEKQREGEQEIKKEFVRETLRNRS